MRINEHTYDITTRWESESGTADYRSYSRDHLTAAVGPGTLNASADPAFHGSRDRWNPEQLLLSALSSCHMLSFLHEAVMAGVVVVAYEDQAHGVMTLDANHHGQFASVTLRPTVKTAEPLARELEEELHHRAHEVCFIARSVNFPVSVELASGDLEEAAA
jgi:organic hydroperoxide reductase OsmC/OhrA